MSESETIENHEQVLESDGSFERDFSELEKCDFTPGRFACPPCEMNFR